MRRYLLPQGLAFGLLSGLATLSGLHYCGLLPLQTLDAALPPLCPFKALTGIPCPGCGMTSALLATAQGSLAVAALHNPFAGLLLCLAGISLLPEGAIRRMPHWASVLMHRFLVLSLLSVGAYWLGTRVLPLLFHP